MTGLRRLARVIVPGLLVAATGVGAGDLLTASFAGMRTGPTILWAVVIGALMKFVLNESLSRRHLETGETMIEEWRRRLPGPLRAGLMFYFVVWSLSVGAALMSACGNAAHALWPLSDDPRHSRLLWGAIHSLLALLLLFRGRFAWFERGMAGLIALMFIGVPLAALPRVVADPVAILRGIFLPALPPGEALWVIGLIGGVGGTVTVLAYDYWMREQGRPGRPGALRTTRIDLGIAYALTAAFGMAMILLAAPVNFSTATAPGNSLPHLLADQVAAAFGEVGHVGFRLAFWAAVFSSLLGVWQAVPILFANLGVEKSAPHRARTIQWYRATLGCLPLGLAMYPLAAVQLLYAVLGALFMPWLALNLLVLQARPGRWTKGRLFSQIALLGILVFFSYAALVTLRRLL